MTNQGIFEMFYHNLESITPNGVNPITFFSVFIIVFTVVYSILRKMELFKAKDNKVNTGAVGVIALVFALVVAISPDVSGIITLALPGAGLIMIIVLVLLFSLALISPNTEKFTQNMPKIGVVLIILIIIGWIFISSMNFENQKTLLNTQSFDIGALKFTPKDISLVIITLFVLSFVFIISSALKKKGNSST